MDIYSMITPISKTSVENFLEIYTFQLAQALTLDDAALVELLTNLLTAADVNDGIFKSLYNDLLFVAAVNCPEKLTGSIFYDMAKIVYPRKAATQPKMEV